LADARPYATPQARELLAVAKPDLRDECLQILRAWASAEDGTLACGSYQRWRAGRAGYPTRSTITRQPGSWHGALAAAGVADRAAVSPEVVDARRRAGELRRHARQRAQRERVVDAVRRFAGEYGRFPRALEFVRWRLESVVDAPTQGTVYRLFPGGWAEVLQVAGATV
jgi:hypothetical protein